ncbi:MAG: hypothetical protein LBB81_10670 [Treponema sp.]|jgi:hypothetical protein|nr:hypothetical protein [Treponema sp.]
MKKFISDIPYRDTSIKPENDYSNAKKFQYIYIGNHFLFYRWLLIMIRFIPIKNIARCYIRVDSCNAACCCGRVPFDSKSLILVTREGKQRKLWLDNRRILDSIIEELKLKNNDIITGYPRETVQCGKITQQTTYSV